MNGQILIFLLVLTSLFPAFSYAQDDSDLPDEIISEAEESEDPEESDNIVKKLKFKIEEPFVQNKWNYFRLSWDHNNVLFTKPPRSKAYLITLDKNKKKRTLSFPIAKVVVGKNSVGSNTSLDLRVPRRKARTIFDLQFKNGPATQVYRFLFYFNRSGKLQMKQKLLASSEDPTPDKNTKESNKGYYSRLGLGLGVTAISLDVQIPDVDQSLSFTSFQYPAYSLWYRQGISKSSHMGVFTNYQSHPGSIPVADNQTIDSDSFTWDIINLGYFHFPEFMTGKSAQFGYQIGYSQQTTPFIIEASTDSFELDTVTTGFLSLGVALNYSLFLNYMFDFDFSYYYPVAKDSNYTFTNTTWFGGSVGLRSTGKGFNYGLFWYGQFQDINLETEILSSTREGTISLLHSTLEARLIWNFGDATNDKKLFESQNGTKKP